MGTEQGNEVLSQHNFSQLASLLATGRVVVERLVICPFEYFI